MIDQLNIPDSTRLPQGMARQGMSISLIEGMVVAGMYIFLEQWLVPLLQNRLGSTNPHIAQHIALALTTLPVLLSVVMGLAMHWVIHHLGGPRRAVIIAALVQIIALVLLIPTIYFPQEAWCLPTALALGCCIQLVNPFSQTGWYTWMGELIPMRIQGRYFGARTQAFHSARLIFFLLFAYAIFLFPVGPQDGGGTGLLLVLLSAIACRIASVCFLIRQPVPPTLENIELPPSMATSMTGLWAFLRSAPHTPFGRWTLLWSSMFFGIGITGPFVATYLTAPIEQGGLHLVSNPWLYAGISQCGAITRLILMPVMGRLVDRYGSIAVLRFSLIGVSIVTVGWAWITDPRWLLLNEVFASCCWSGAETAIVVLLLTCHEDPAQRSRLVGYYHLLAGIAAVLSSLVGTVLISTLPPFHGSVFRSLFLAGLCIRIPVALLAFWLLASISRRGTSVFNAEKPRTP